MRERHTHRKSNEQCGKRGARAGWRGYTGTQHMPHDISRDTAARGGPGPSGLLTETACQISRSPTHTARRDLRAPVPRHAHLVMLCVVNLHDVRGNLHKESEGTRGRPHRNTQLATHRPPPLPARTYVRLQLAVVVGEVWELEGGASEAGEGAGRGRGGAGGARQSGQHGQRGRRMRACW